MEFVKFKEELKKLFGDRITDERVKLFYDLVIASKDRVVIKTHTDDLPIGIIVVIDDIPFVVGTLKLFLERNSVGYSEILSLLYEGRLVNWVKIDKPVNLKEDVLERLKYILTALSYMVDDFAIMKKVLREAMVDIEYLIDVGKVEQNLAEEISLFLDWLREDNFVFFGYLEVEKVNGEFVVSDRYGVLREEFLGKIPFRESEIFEMLFDVENFVIVDKLSQNSFIHRPGKLDVVAVKKVLEDGSLDGWRVWLGLLTRKAISSKGSDIPLIRRKLIDVIMKREILYGSYEYKQLKEIFDAIPVEELFVMSPEEVNEVVDLIHSTKDVRKTSTFIRMRKRQGILSVMVILPADRLSVKVSDEVREALKSFLSSEYVDYRMTIHENIGILHYFLTPGRGVDDTVLREIEVAVEGIVSYWDDRLFEALMSKYKAGWDLLWQKYVKAFPEEYKKVTSPTEAVVDIERLEVILSGEVPIGVRVKEDLVKIYSVNPLRLSDVVTVFENFYITVFDHVTFEITVDEKTCYIYTYYIMVKNQSPLKHSVIPKFEEALENVMMNLVESDPLNGLVVVGGLSWKEVDVLRTYRNYIRQIKPQIAYATTYAAFLNYPELAKFLVNLFDIKFNPHLNCSFTERLQLFEDKKREFHKLLMAVPTLAEEKIFRTYLNAIEATVRTNFYKDKESHYISIKVDCSKIEGMPHPSPFVEVYIHSINTEAVHLRNGKIARGGIRWSDRYDDFRTEILSLMRTQIFKNSIIVPTGAKGGFVVKGHGDDAVVKAYTDFIKGLLDITDNLVNGKVVKPKDVVCYDGDDYYLVVAADKGTAKMSDLANSIAKSYGYWLYDAFASGGSTGYDHKEYGVTAKGAWVCVKRHLYEIGKNPDRDIITVIGIGDMSGDVFGNGMLYSKNIKLLAAFNHKYIFIDPDPDPEVSYKERLRLFIEGRDWDGYNQELISRGGGVYRRDARSIKLSDRAREILGTEKVEVSGEDLIKLILTMEADLLWNGGIGTYVKSSLESHFDVKDPHNDNVRVDAKDLKVKVVAEGGNLGFTQKARVEFALKGGKINMDSIDNSAGVNTSDYEVNLKILLNQLLAEGVITEEDRVKIIKGVVNEVMERVYSNNYSQSIAIGLDCIRSVEDPDDFIIAINELESDGVLDRNEMFLPTNTEYMQRVVRGIGLTRPEVAQLISCEKIWLKEKLLTSNVLKHSYFDRFVLSYFPETISNNYKDYVIRHPLRTEIVATTLVNRIVDTMGVTFVHSMRFKNGVEPHEIVSSFVIAEGIVGLDDLVKRVASFDGLVDPNVQYMVYLDVTKTIKNMVVWSSYFVGDWLPLKDVIEKYRSMTTIFKRYLVTKASMSLDDPVARKRNYYVSAGFPNDVATEFAVVSLLADSMDVITLSEYTKLDVEFTASIYDMVTKVFKLDEVINALDRAPKKDRWDWRFYNTVRRDVYIVRRKLVERAVRCMKSEGEFDVERFNDECFSFMRAVVDDVESLILSSRNDMIPWAVVVRRMKDML